MLVRIWRMSPVLALVVGVGTSNGCRKNPASSDFVATGTSAPAGTPGDPGAAPARVPAAELGPPCGEDGKPECPLQRWMDETMSAAMTTKSGYRLADGFAYLAALDPPGFPQWRALAELGREAANRGDFGAAKRICAACHDQYRPRFRSEEGRRRVLPPPLPPPSSPP
jgi:hypothetical protein